VKQLVRWPGTLLALLATGALLPACEKKDPCDGIDNDGDGAYDEDLELHEVIRPFFIDADGDGFGNVDFVETSPIYACAAPEGMVNNNWDCDDADSDRNPHTLEDCNGIDDNCDGQVDEGVGTTYYTDADGDGFGDPGTPEVACEQPGGTVENAEDCDDADPDSHPGADEICDGADNDCDGSLLEGEDTDGDGDGALACDDCDDDDPISYPGAPEVCDGADNDCDGDVPAEEVDADGDGFLSCAECNDANPAIHPDAFEVCDGVDANCDGFVDTADLDGSGWPDCGEVLVIVSGPFAGIVGICAVSSLPYPDTEVAAVEAAVSDVGWIAAVVEETDVTGVSALQMAEHPAIVVLNGGLPWGAGFLSETLPALGVAHAAGIPVLFAGDDVAHQVDSQPLLSALSGLEGTVSTGAADSVNILETGHGLVNGPHGFVTAFYADADMDVAELTVDALLVAEQAANGAPAIVAVEPPAGVRSATQLFGVAASWEICPQVAGDDAAILLRNTLDWLTD